MGKIKERNFVNPFKLFFGNSEVETGLSQLDIIDSSDISEEEKDVLKRALKEVEKFEKQMNNTADTVRHMNASKSLNKASISKVKVNVKTKQQNDRERE